MQVVSVCLRIGYSKVKMVKIVFLLKMRNFFNGWKTYGFSKRTRY